MKHIIAGLMMVSNALMANPQYQVLVSFSMPERLLQETLADCARHDIPVLLNGFHHDSMRETAVKLFELSKKIPNLSMQIDPTAFERFGVTQVPAWVVSEKDRFDVVLGNVTFERARDELLRFGSIKEST